MPLRPESLIKIHFAGLNTASSVVPLAAACGVGIGPRNHGVTGNRYAQLDASIAKLIVATCIDDADLIVYPHPFVDCPQARWVQEEARSRNLPCLFFQPGDDPSPGSLDYGVLFRESLLQSRQKNYEDVLPPIVDDPACSRVLIQRPYSQVPSVGFCGFTGGFARVSAYKLLGRKEKALGLYLRERALRAIERDTRVRSSFIRRSGYWGGAVNLTNRRFRILLNKVLGQGTTPDPERNFQREGRVYSEFLSNIFDNDYTLCIRGAGNYSYRLYEVLASGRIPVLVNSDCVLPFADEISWGDHLLPVEECDISELPSRICEFHRHIGDAEFYARQIRNRRLFETYFQSDALILTVLKRAISGFNGVNCAFGWHNGS